MRPFFFAALITLTNLAHAEVAESGAGAPTSGPGGLTCDQQKRLLDILRSSAQTPEQFFASPAMKKDLIFAGDTHSGWDEKFYSRIIKEKSREHGQGCLFLESDTSTAQKALDSCNENGGPDSSVQGEWRGGVNCPGGVHADTAWGRTSETALKNRWKVFAVDRGFECDKNPGDMSAVDSVKCRNPHMAEKIADAMKSGCKFGLVVNGTLHLDPRVIHDGTTQALTQNELKRRGLNATYSTLAMTSTSQIRRALNPSCGNDSSFLSSYYGVVDTSKIPADDPNVRGILERAWPEKFDHSIIGDDRSEP
jgi:hypothetical protein